MISPKYWTGLITSNIFCRALPKRIANKSYVPNSAFIDHSWTWSAESMFPVTSKARYGGILRHNYPSLYAQYYHRTYSIMTGLIVSEALKLSFSINVTLIVSYVEIETWSVSSKYSFTIMTPGVWRITSHLKFKLGGVSFGDNGSPYQGCLDTQSGSFSKKYTLQYLAISSSGNSYMGTPRVS